MRDSIAPVPHRPYPLKYSIYRYSTGTVVVSATDHLQHKHFTAVFA